MRPAAFWTAMILAAAPFGPAEAEPACGSRAGLEREIVALHRHVLAVQSRALRARSVPADRTTGGVAVLEDRGDLVIARNPFDLEGTGIRFSPDRDGGYAAEPELSTPGPPGASTGLTEERAVRIALPFAFPFFGRTYREAFLHANGHVTFERADDEPGPPGLARFLEGPPRIAAFSADLDIARGGTVTARIEPGRAAFLWAAVPGGGQLNRNTFEIALSPAGEVGLSYGREMQSREALVGLSPGGATDASAVDFSRPARGRGALLERFSETEKVDLPSVTRRLFAAHGDLFAQVVVYTTRPLNPVGGTLAFEVNVRNEIEGIGLDQFDHSAEWGSAGVLESVVFMDGVDPYLQHDGFEFLAHEVGHRWLSRLRFRSASGPSAALLGRGNVHWSFFLDSDASVMEGNDLVDRGGGRFETVDIVRGFSALDQYVMGLRDAAEVPPFFYVEAPDDFRPNRAYKASSGPEPGVSFTGVRRDVTVGDVVAALGPRRPSAGPRVIRQAFVLVADAEAPATDARVAALGRIRARFGTYFRVATEGRGAVDTELP